MQQNRWRLVVWAAAGLIGWAAAVRADDHTDKRLYQLDEAGLSKLLAQLYAAEPDPIKRVATLARMGIDQPYEIYLLGEFPFEDHDPDPLYCLTKSDCVTFCEHIFSMALAKDFDSFLQNLQRLRYRDGQIGMLTRNHFTVADWDRNNAFLFEDQTARLGDAKAAVPLTQVCKRARFFAKFGIGQDIPDEPIEDHFIPKANVPGILAELRTADFINIIRGDEKSQWAGHTGLIMVADDGSVNFLHSARPAVREQPLVEYLESDRKCVGIKVLRLRDDPESRLRQAVESGKSANLTSQIYAAMKRRYDDAPATAKPLKVADYRKAMQFQAYRLDYDTPVDPQLQKKLESIDRDIADRLGIPADKRAAGALDLNNLRLAMVEPDRMFYAASVPKICILLAYFDTNPDAARDLSPEVALELGRMIKVSDNGTAAKYGQLIGMEKIQSIIQSDRYAFYDAEHGGGLWYGKHYSQGEPRIGDPLHDHSHGATVRQCLRFYLMMEQGRLVSPAASTKMREIFATPQLEHNDAGFVKGLQGRDLTLIRKSGTWENWRLDTARIEHDPPVVGGRQAGYTDVYLLAAMAEHERAGEYLEALAASVDDHLRQRPAEQSFRHQIITHEEAAEFGLADSGNRTGGVLMRMPLANEASTELIRFESPVVATDRLFNEALVSWNVDAPPHLGYCVEIRVGRRADDSWSPYMYISDGGPALDVDRVTKFDHGRIDIDYFTSDERFDRIQYRFRAAARTLPEGVLGADHAAMRINRVTLCLSDITGRITSVPRPTYVPQFGKLSVPPPYPDLQFRSQETEDRKIAGRICSPTSLAMVMEYRGVNRPTIEVAQRAYDPHHDLYGVWPRAIQTAYSYCIPGYLNRFENWSEVRDSVLREQPPIISITVEEGQLRDAPYPSTEGHLLVLTGFDGKGGVLVNDPAFSDDAGHNRVYAMEDLERVWLKAKRGTAYILSPHPDEPLTSSDPAKQPLVDLTDVDPRIILDLRYATDQNFTKTRLYESATCLLRESVAYRLRRVQDRLVAMGLGLKVYDGYRPIAVQRRMWELVPDPKYVADPAKGSRHNRGAAVDVTLVDAEGRELEMPTAYDDFTPAAHRDYAGGSGASRKNRALLEEVMTAEGFIGLDSEWWHFDDPQWEKFPIEYDEALIEVGQSK